MDLGADFDAAAELLALPPPPAGGDGGIDDLGADFDAVAAVLARRPPAPDRLGLPPRSKATAAYARRCQEAQRAQAKAADLQSRLRDLTERPGCGHRLGLNIGISGGTLSEGRTKLRNITTLEGLLSSL